MRISTVTLNNFLVHTGTMLTIPSGVNLTVVAGPNRAGKSAIGQAIRLGLFGDPVRGIDKKNEISALRTYGATKGVVSVDTDLGLSSLSLSSGKHDAMPAAMPAMLPYTLDPSLFFAEKDAGKRAQIIMKACGIRQNKERIFGDLEASGFSIDVLESLEWQAGLGIAEQRAREAALEAKRRWCFVTGEKTYGEKKAEGWTAPEVPPMQFDEDDLAQATSTVQKRLQAAQEHRATLRANAEAAQRAAKARQTAAGAADIAERIGAQRDVLQRQEEELATVTADATSPGGTLIKCPCCNEDLLLQASGKLLKYTAPKGNPARAAVRKRELEGEVATTRNAIQSLEAQLRAAEAALAALGDVPDAPSDADLKMAESEVTRHQGMLEESQQKLRDLERHQGDVDAAAKRTEQAGTAHAQVAIFISLADAIHDLPGKYVGEALVTVNGWLDEIVEAAFTEDGPSIKVHPDMSVTIGPTHYELASMSEQWRIELGLAYAIAMASQCGILMMDCLDLIQPDERGDILGFFQDHPDVQTILIGTLKQKWEAGEGAQCIWLGA